MVKIALTILPAGYQARARLRRVLPDATRTIYLDAPGLIVWSEQMPIQRRAANGYCVFEYMYRDAGNWKTNGALLLAGEANDARTMLHQYCESGELFVAEQLGVPSLCPEHFTSCGDGPSDLDHAYHEFVDLRPATDGEVAAMSSAGSLDDLVARMQAAAGNWDVTLSPNCYL